MPHLPPSAAAHRAPRDCRDPPTCRRRWSCKFHPTQEHLLYKPLPWACGAGVSRPCAVECQRRITRPGGLEQVTRPLCASGSPFVGRAAAGAFPGLKASLACSPVLTASPGEPALAQIALIMTNHPCRASESPFTGNRLPTACVSAALETRRGFRTPPSHGAPTMSPGNAQMAKRAGEAAAAAFPEPSPSGA